jgi:hypothetical protein
MGRTVAEVVVKAGPAVGGPFLAFPAILTLVAKREGAHRAREDARGAALGALGLTAFGVVVRATTPRWPVVVTLVTATMAWAVVSGVAYLLVAARHRHAGEGRDPAGWGAAPRPGREARRRPVSPAAGVAADGRGGSAR